MRGHKNLRFGVILNQLAQQANNLPDALRMDSVLRFLNQEHPWRIWQVQQRQVAQNYQQAVGGLCRGNCFAIGKFETDAFAALAGDLGQA